MDCIYLFALSFTAANQSGIALVSASTQQNAFTILKNAGRYNGVPDAYTLVQATKLGVYTENRYELLFESYTNAIVAYDAIVNTIRHLVTREEFIEILGYTPADAEDLANKVDKEEGKGLSEANYTAEEKNKLANIDMSTVENIIETIKRNGVILPIINKSVDISVPTALSQLSSDETHRIVTDNEKVAWNDKYDKPSAGIPKSDLSDTVQESLNLADSAAEVIPNTASPENKLVDKAYVDSSISTASATFRGTSAQNLTELQFLAWANNLTHDLNDYVYWNTTDSSGNTVYKRYKFNGSTWIFEYDINNSSFSAAEWAAIQSGITDVLVNKLANMPSVDTINAKLDRADTDHTRAESDHSTAAQDHTQATSDHQQAAQDHTQAETDHTRAESDHTRAESDHTRAGEDHASIADKVSQEELAVAIEPLARKDGSYDTMSVGLAKNLEGRTNVTDSFFERTAGGDAEVANGLAQMTEVGGNSVKFNQLEPDGQFAGNWVAESGRSVSFENGVASIEITGNQGNQNGIIDWSPNAIGVIANHIYILACCAKVATQGASLKMSNTFISSYSSGTQNHYLTDSWVNYFDRLTPSQATNRLQVNIRITDTVVGGVAQIKNVNVFDLTAIFGPGNEPETVEDFEAWLASNIGKRAYYPYDPGSVLNVNMAGIETVGRNLLDPTTGKARIIGAYSDVYGNYYGITGTHGAITFTSDMGETSTITPDEDGKFLLEEPGELSVADAGADCCVFLWWDGTQTDYAEHKDEKTYLDVTHIYGKLNGTGDLVRVWPTGMPKIGDLKDLLRVENGVAVARRPIGEIIYNGTESWDYFNGSFRLANPFGTASAKTYSGTNIGRGFCIFGRANETSGYPNNGQWKIVNNTNHGICFARNLVPSLSEATDASGWKTWLTSNPLAVYYDLATPEVYTDLVYQGSSYFDDGTPVTLPLNYNVDNWGIERVLPINTSEAIATAKPELTCKYSIDAVETLNTHADEIEDLYDKNEELDAKKPNKTGDYPGMAVGSAKVLEGTDSKVEDFVFTVSQCADGIAKLNEVRGKSLVWNQLIAKGDNDLSKTENGVTFTDNRDGTYTVFTSAEGASGNATLNLASFQFTYQHKYLWLGCPKGGSENTYHIRDAYWGAPKDTGSGYIGTFSANEGLYKTTFAIRVQSGTIITTPIVFKPNFIDLTLMFGAGNEPSTVAEFEAMFPLPYYDYNPGEIISNKTEAVEVTGRNQWDEEWELGTFDAQGQPSSSINRIRTKNYIPIFPETVYYRKSTKTGWNIFYDANKNFISAVSATANQTFTTPANAYYLKFDVPEVTYNHDICINLSDPSFNGQYEQYKHNTIELNLPTLTGKLNGEGESVVVFPDGLKSAGSVYDEIVVNKAIKRVGVVDLGTIEWKKTERAPLLAPFFEPTVFTLPVGSSNATFAKYPLDSDLYRDDKEDAYDILESWGTLIIRDNTYSTAADFKTAMNGILLYYELAEPLVYELDEGIPETFQAYKGGTMRQLPENGSEPTTAPCVMSVTYALDAVGILTGLPQNYVSKESLQAMLTAMQSAGLFASYTMTYNATTGKYEFTFTANS